MGIKMKDGRLARQKIRSSLFPHTSNDRELATSPGSFLPFSKAFNIRTIFPGLSPKLPPCHSYPLVLGLSSKATQSTSNLSGIFQMENKIKLQEKECPLETRNHKVYLGVTHH